MYCESVCARLTDSDKQGDEEKNRVKYRRRGKTVGYRKAQT